MVAPGLEGRYAARMRELSTDVAIIGAGSAGLNARREVERAGKSWLLIESGAYGTTCARSGCMPSKLLIAAAEAAQTARDAAVFGVQIDPAAIRVDGRAVLERVRRERDRFVGLVAQDVQALPASQRLHGSARFLEQHLLQVDDHTRVRAGAVVVATGSSPKLPKELNGVRGRVLTSDTIFELPDLPRSLAVLGTGAIGLELGQALASLGVRVHAFNPNPIVGFFSDPVMQERSRTHWGALLPLSLGVQDLTAERAGEGVRLRFKSARGHAEELEVDYVLAAVGRAPNVQALDLPHTQLKLNERGLPHFDPETMQCDSAPIFLAGDVSGFRPLLHEAVDDGAIAGANAARYPDVQRMARKAALSIAFTQPRMAMVGSSFKQLQGKKIAIGESSYENQGRARVIAEAHGAVRVYVDCESTRLLGAELFGPAVEHTAHLLAWAVQSKEPVLQLLNLPVYHPTLEEGVRTALRNAAQQLQLLGGCLPTERGLGPAD